MLTSFFFLFALVICVFIGGIIFLIVYVTRRSTEPKSTTFVKTERQEMLERVQQVVSSKAAPWNGRTFRDISHSERHMSMKGISTTVKGRLFSLDETCIIAFERVQRGWHGDGSLVASSTEFTLMCAFTSGDILIQLNQELLGTLTKSGAIFTQAGQQIGSVRRNSRSTTDIGELISFHTGSNQSPVILNGRQLATIWAGPQFSTTLFDVNQDNSYSNSVITLNATPDATEEKWLLVLAILEIAYFRINVII